MNTRRFRRLSVTLAFGLSLTMSRVTPAQTIRVDIPGAAFTPTLSKATIQDFGRTRRFRAAAFAKLILIAPLRLPPGTPGKADLRRLVVHFRSTQSGPRLRTVMLRSGEFRLLDRATDAVGDYSVRVTNYPNPVANAWEWKDPLSVAPGIVVQLEVQFPGGIDSQINTGDFDLISVETDFVRPLRQTLTPKERTSIQLPH
jgi:hypothetical protein